MNQMSMKGLVTQDSCGVSQGDVYKHYKGNFYKVYGTVRHSETEEMMVLYQALYGDFGYWVRPLTMFMEDVNCNGVIMKRFEKIETSMEKPTVDNLYKDPKALTEPYPEMLPLILKQGSSDMFGIMLTPGGQGPHPTMLLLHGFPGNERNFDLGHALRRMGWNVMIFHYRGTWGSGGTFSFANALSDIDVAIEFLKSPEGLEKYKVDKERLVVAGNSFGGFSSILSAMKYPDLKGCISLSTYDLGMLGQHIENDPNLMAEMRAMFEDCVAFTSGGEVESLVQEVISHKMAWNLTERSSALKGRPVLIISGNKDIDGPPEFHFDPLVKALINSEVLLESHLLDSDHGFQNKRIEISNLIGTWLNNLL